MSTDTNNPAADDHRRKVLEENRDVFETIRDGEDISEEFSYQFGHKPLQILEQLQEGETNAE